MKKKDNRIYFLKFLKDGWWGLNPGVQKPLSKYCKAQGVEFDINHALGVPSEGLEISKAKSQKS